MSALPRIADYALLSDQKTCALVSKEGDVDFHCLSSFSGPAVFSRLLDARRGGTFRVGPLQPARSVRRYLSWTNVLETEHQSATGRIRVTDFLSLAGGGPPSREWERLGGSRLLRRVEALAGELDVEIRFRPAFDFGRARTQVEPTRFGALGRAQRSYVALCCPVPLAAEDEGGARAVVRLRAGQTLWLRMFSGEGELPLERVWSDEQCAWELERTCAHWRSFCRQIRYEGPYREAVLRSALVLAGCIDAESGAMVAAPTLGLPEEYGAPRNFDYRYAWVRDSAMAARSLFILGLERDAERLVKFLLESLRGRLGPSRRVAVTTEGKTPPKMRRMRGVSGYRGTGPVMRGFRTRPELDDLGEILDAAALVADSLTLRHWRVLRRFGNLAARRWHHKDRSIWEFPGPTREYCFSRVMCWVALDRAIRIARRRRFPAPLRAWTRTRERIRREVLARGYDEREHAFTMVLGERGLDASLLTVPLTGLLPATDQRMLDTIHTVRDRLAMGPLVYRYLVDDHQPGLGNPFVICSFWLCEALLFEGDVRGARRIFEGIVAHSSDLGLLSEEIDVRTHELMGNFPQALSHLALIRAAHFLGEAERLGVEAFRESSPYARLNRDPEALRTEPTLR